MNRLRTVIQKWRTDFNYKTFFNSSFSFVLSVIFALYNGYLGIHLKSLWNGSVCTYYLLLSAIRSMLILTENRIRHNPSEKDNQLRKKIFITSSVLLLFINAALIIPVSLMVKMEKPVSMTLIPSITMAAYTTYKIILAVINYRKKDKSTNLFVKELRTLNLMDAIVSVITLQNTLIMTVSHDVKSMLAFTAVTSAVMLIIMITVSVISLINGLKQFSVSGER